MKESLDFILAGSEVLRYHTVTTLMRETVGHHSHGVACLTLLLNPNAGRELLTAALWHDLAEHQTGDIPSPAKREYGIGEQVARRSGEAGRWRRGRQGDVQDRARCAGIGAARREQAR